MTEPIRSGMASRSPEKSVITIFVIDNSKKSVLDYIKMRR
jgi:hypothetical protein